MPPHGRGAAIRTPVGPRKNLQTNWRAPSACDSLPTHRHSRSLTANSGPVESRSGVSASIDAIIEKGCQRCCEGARNSPTPPWPGRFPCAETRGRARTLSGRLAGEDNKRNGQPPSKPDPVPASSTLAAPAQCRHQTEPWHTMAAPQRKTDTKRQGSTPTVNQHSPATPPGASPEMATTGCACARVRVWVCVDRPGAPGATNASGVHACLQRRGI